jgi:hypothetical protein
MDLIHNGFRWFFVHYRKKEKEEALDRSRLKRIKFDEEVFDRGTIFPMAESLIEIFKEFFVFHVKKEKEICVDSIIREKNEDLMKKAPFFRRYTLKKGDKDFLKPYRKCSSTAFLALY